MTLLDVAGYGLSHYADAFLGLAGKIFLGGLGVFFGGIFLLLFALIATVGIMIFATVRGVEQGSLLKATGTFFRLVGLTAGIIIGLIVMPAALVLKASFLTALLITAGVVATGYFVGFIISEIIALRLWKYEFYIRTFNILRYKITDLGNE